MTRNLGPWASETRQLSIAAINWTALGALTVCQLHSVWFAVLMHTDCLWRLRKIISNVSRYAASCRRSEQYIGMPWMDKAFIPSPKTPRPSLGPVQPSFRWLLRLWGCQAYPGSPSSAFIISKRITVQVHLLVHK